MNHSHTLHNTVPRMRGSVAKAKLINGTPHFLLIRKASITDSVVSQQAFETLAQPVPTKFDK